MNRESENTVALFSKPKLRRVGKRIMPTVQELPKEEIMKTNTYQRFISFMNIIFELLDETDQPIRMDEEKSTFRHRFCTRKSINVVNKLRSVNSTKNSSAGPDMPEDLVY